MCFLNIGLATGLTSLIAVRGSRHVRISAAPTHVKLAGEEGVVASSGVDEEGAAAPAAAAMANDESDDEADREVSNCQLTPWLVWLPGHAARLHKV